jgi:hypothetical protein
MFNNETLYVALQSEIADNNETAKSFSEDILGNDEVKREKAIEKVNAKLNLMDDYFSGRALSEAAYKSVNFPTTHKSSGALNSSSFRIDAIESWFNTQQIDTKWMQMFRTVSASGVSEIELVDWFSKVVHKEYQDGEQIKGEPLGQNAFDRLGAKRFGGAALLLRRLTISQARYNLQNILMSHQMRELSTKADQAYTAIAGATPAGTTNFAASIINSINNGVVDLCTSMAAAGFDVNDDTPMFFLAHGAHKSAVLSAFDTIAGENGSNIRLRYNVTPVFTFNSNYPEQIGGTDYGKLIVPGIKNIYGNFENARVEEVRTPSKDASEIVYQYYCNWKVEGSQIQRVNIA